MFDTFLGLPLHVLILHATVMLVPLGAAVSLGVLLRARWREHYIGLLAGLNLALLALTFVTVQAGQALQTQLGGQVAQDHERYGRILLWIVLALAIGTFAAWIVQRHDVAPAARQGFAGLVALVAVGSGVQTVVVGHSGSESKWGGTFDRKSSSASAQAPDEGADADPKEPVGNDQNAAETVRIVIKDFKFVPADVTVKRGQKLTVVNMDTVQHTLTADDGSFDTGLLSKGKSKTIAAKKSGKNPFHCDPHQYMTGTITVS